MIERGKIPNTFYTEFFILCIPHLYNLTFLHGNHRVVIIERHRIVEISGSFLYAVRSLGFRKEWIVVLVEARQDGNWVWSVEGVVVV